MKYLLAVLMTQKGKKSLLRMTKFTNIAGRLPENSRDRRYWPSMGKETTKEIR